MTEAHDNASPGARRPGSIVFGLVVGFLVAFGSYHWITDTDRRAVRAEQEVAVRQARRHVEDRIGRGDLEIVDPLAPRRPVGKVYVYAAGDGFEVSGYYRRGESDSWHPYLATLAADGSLEHLKVQDDDPGLAARARTDAELSVVD